MSTSNSKDFTDFVTLLGNTRSKQEEDTFILAEQAKLKVSMKDKSASVRQQKENLIKCMYIEMLGHDTSFAHFSAVQMAQSAKSLLQKRLGYLTCCLFLHESSEMLILLVATFQKDLQSKNLHEIIIALTALAKLINKTIMQGVSDLVLKLLVHQTDLVRKKALIVVHKMHQVAPELLVDYDDQVRRAFCDVEPSVMGVSLNMYLEVIKEEPDKYKKHTSMFVQTLKQIIDLCLPSEFEYCKISAPWMQIKLLQILSMLGQKDQKESDKIYEILGETLRRASNIERKIGFAVTYQCVKTIANIYPYAPLLELAATTVSRFLKIEKNDLKYLGINALISIVQVNSSCVLDHQMIIMDCLESTDDTLKQETLQLLFKMTNLQNVTAIVDRLLVFLKYTQDAQFRKDLVQKITSLAERFSPTTEWYLKTMNAIFEHSSDFISSEMLNSFLKTLSDQASTEGPVFGGYLIESYLQIIKKPNLADITYQLIAWVFGEIGANTFGKNEEKLKEIVESLLEVIMNSFEDNTTRGWIISALAKLSSCPAFTQQEEVAECFEYYSDSQAGSVACRALEYKLLSKYNAALRQSTQIKVDPELHFLDAFVADAVKKGAPKYDSKKLTETLLGTSAASQTSTLKYDAYETQTIHKNNAKRPINNKEKFPITANDSDNPIWGKEGFNNNKQEIQIASRTEEVVAKQKQQEIVVQEKVEEQKQKAKTQPVIPQDPKKLQKELFAKNIFNSIGQPAPLQPQKQPVYPVPQNGFTKSTPAANTINLLDDDDDQEEEQEISAFVPHRITVDEYEKQWEQLAVEISVELKGTRAKTEGALRGILRTIGIAVIEVSDNDLICVGKTNNYAGKIVLVYLSFTPSGDLSLTIRSSEKQSVDSAIAQLKKHTGGAVV